MAREMYDLTKTVINIAFIVVAGITFYKMMKHKKSGKKDDKKDKE